MTEYRVVPADLERDRDTILALWGRHLLAHAPDKHPCKYAWHYKDSPYGPNRCWLLLSGVDGRAVGTAGLGSRHLQIGGMRVRVGVCCDLAVDKEHRWLQPALLLQKAVLGCLGDDLPLIYGVPNSNALAVLKRSGYQEFETLRQYVKLLRVGHYCQHYGGAWQALRPFAPIVDMAMRVRYEGLRGRKHGRVFQELPVFDERFDALWQCVSAGLSSIGERTTNFLRWRYGNCPLRRYVALGLLTQDQKRLLGYAVCNIGENEQVAVVDLLAEETGDVARDLLAGLLSWARQRHAASVAVTCLPTPRFEQSLQQFGFVLRRCDRHLAVARAPSSDLPHFALKDWHFLTGDEAYD